MTSVFKKQYVLSSYRLDLPNLREIQIGEAFLYAHEKLNLTVCKTKDAKQAFVLGNSFCADVEGKRIEEDLSEAFKENLQSATGYWTGRWALICEDELIIDACGLIGAFYVVTDKGWLVSSSLAVISEITGKNLKKRVSSEGLSWQLLPRTRLDEAEALLCTQKLTFSKSKVEAIFSSWVNDYSELPTDKKCEAVANMLVCACKNIHTFSGKKIALALTGGKDSRLSLSALLKAGIPFSTCTAEHKNISYSDKTVPQTLAKVFGFSHTYIKEKPFDKERLSDYYNFCAGNSDGADAQFYARRQLSSFGENVILLRSGIFEAGQSYARSYTSSDMEGFATGIITYYSDLKSSEEQKNAFSEWKEYAIQNPIENVDIRDRFYMEQRVGGWAAAIEQSLDINEFTSIQIANCRELVSVLLSCNEEERKSLALSYETIRLLEPKTLDVAVNKRTLRDKLLRVRGVLKNPVGKLKNYLRKNRR